MPWPSEPPIRVLVVDDHPMVREGLRSMLHGDGVEIAGEAASGAEALGRAAARDVDVVLLDLELPDMDGLAVLRRLREIDARLPVLVVTMHQDPALVRRAVEAGATGYVLKGIGRSELLASIRAVRRGEAVFDQNLLRAVLASRDVAPAVVADGAGFERLSRVELDLLRLIAAGLTNRQIGQRLHWSHATVKKYVQRVLEKLDVQDRTRAAVEGVRRGLVD
jgi:DNA-binding NarL/FixJ family response regulator